MCKSWKSSQNQWLGCPYGPLRPSREFAFRMLFVETILSDNGHSLMAANVSLWEQTSFVVLIQEYLLINSHVINYINFNLNNKFKRYCINKTPNHNLLKWTKGTCTRVKYDYENCNVQSREAFGQYHSFLKLMYILFELSHL